MTTQEFSTEFDILYNNISSGQAPGLNEYEKSVFLTKAQSEIIKNYFNPKGNKYEEGFDDSPKRQIDFSMLMKTVKVSEVSSSINLHNGSNTGYYEMPQDILIYINEFVNVKRKNQVVKLVVVPLNFTEYNRLMSKAFKRPLKYQAWRLISSGEGMSYTFTDYANVAEQLKEVSAIYASFETIYKAINGKYLTIIDGKYLNVDGYYLDGGGDLVETKTNGVDISSNFTNINKYINCTVNATSTVVQLIPGPSDRIKEYIVRYIRKPRPIILEDLSSESLTIDGVTGESTCELDPILHSEILQRAVELAKAAYSGDLNSSIELGKRSE